MKGLKAFSKITYSEYFSYRGEMFLIFFNEIFKIIILSFIWKFFLRDEDIIRQGQVISFVIMGYLTTQLLGGEISYYFLSDIQTGDISYKLLFPVSYPLQIIYKTFGGVKYYLFHIYFPALIYVYIYIYKIDLTLERAILYIVSLGIGFFILSFVDIILCSFSIYLYNTSSLEKLKYFIISIVSGAIIPYDYFPKSLKKVMDYNPFQFIGYFPNEVLLKNIDFKYIFLKLLLGIVYCICLRWIALFVFKRAIRNLEVNGG